MSAPMLASDANNPQFMGATNPDAALHVQFYNKPVKQTFRSVKEGMPIHETVVFVRIHTPGNQLNIIDTPAREDHKRRFPQHWAHFQNMNAGSGDTAGVPVSHWPMVDVAMAETLKALKFFTVEQVAFASDEQISKLGMQAGMAPFTFRERAKSYLQVAKDSTALAKKNEETEELKKRLAELEELVKGKAQAAAPAEPPAHNPAPPEKPVLNDELAELSAQYKAKFGKAPHHKMKVETIKEKLAA